MIPLYSIVTSIEAMMVLPVRGLVNVVMPLVGMVTFFLGRSFLFVVAVFMVFSYLVNAAPRWSVFPGQG